MRRYLNLQFSTDEEGIVREKETKPKEELKSKLASTLTRGQTLLEKLDTRSQRGRIAYVRSGLERYSKLDMGNLSAALTYYIMLAIVPFLLFVATVLAGVGRGLINRESVQSILDLLPPSLLPYLKNILEVLERGVSVSASIGVVALMWSASRGFAVLVSSLDRVYGNTLNPAKYLLRQLLSLVVTILVAFSMLVILFVMSFGSTFIHTLNNWLGMELMSGIWVNLLSYGVSFTYLMLLFSCLYHFSAKRKIPFRFALLSAGMVAFAWGLLSYGFSIYLDRFARYSIIYGSITGIIILMLWLYLCANLLLIGSLVHWELHQYRLDQAVAKQKEK